MAVHFWPVFKVISRTTSRTKKSNSGEPGATSGPSSAALKLSASMLTRIFCSTNPWMLPDSLAGVRRAGESDGVAELQVIEQIVGRAAQDRQAARRKDSGFDHGADHFLRQPCSRGRRLGQHRNARQQADRGLLPQSPGWEVEGIDVHGHAVERHADVQALKVGVTRQAHGSAVAQQVSVAEFAADLGKIFQGADRAIDINGGVGLGVAGVLRAKSRTSLPAWLRARRQFFPAVRRAGRSSACAAPDLPHCGSSRARISGPGLWSWPRRARPHRGIDQRCALLRARLPLAAQVALQDLGVRCNLDFQLL